MSISPRLTLPKWKSVLGLGLLTFAAVLVHGYHPFAEDAEIYLPGVEKILHPELFPTGQEFFLSHAKLTLFPNVVAFSLRVTHLPLEVGLFLWHVASIFLLLLACWELSGLLFPSKRARWGGVCLVAALLTIPVAGTALYIMDQYLNPRNLAAFAGVFMLVRTLEKKYVQCVVVAGVCGLHASADVGVSIFVLCVAAGDGKIREPMEGHGRARELGVDAARACGFFGVSRSGETARLSLHTEMGVV